MPDHTLIVRVLAAALMLAALTPQAAFAVYRDKAEEATDYIQKAFYDPAEHLYRPAVPRRERDLPFDFSWGNGVQFTALVGATKHNPKEYAGTLKDFTAALRRYWQADAPIPGFTAYLARTGDLKYYDDNAWFVLGFVEAYEVTGDPAYLDWARQTQKFCLSGWDDKLGGGIYWFEDHKSKNTCANAPVAAAAMRLYLVGKDRDQLDWARRIVDWTRRTFQDTDGLFWDNVNLEGVVEKTKWTYNSALMIRSYTLLYQATKDRDYLALARHIADAGIKHWTDPETGGFTNSARFNHLFSESLLRLYDVTKDVRYLNAVRRDASFAYRYVRDPNGGYHNQWRKGGHRANERKELIENAGAARLFWLLTPYPDVDELIAQGRAAISKGDCARAKDLLQQACDSDAESAEARRLLADVLKKRCDDAGAACG
jgi:rhamnogalacturonyl hydrolase YesR